MLFFFERSAYTHFSRQKRKLWLCSHKVTLGNIRILLPINKSYLSLELPKSWPKLIDIPDAESAVPDSKTYASTECLEAGSDKDVIFVFIVAYLSVTNIVDKEACRKSTDIFSRKTTKTHSANTRSRAQMSQTEFEGCNNSRLCVILSAKMKADFYSASMLLMDPYMKSKSEFADSFDITVEVRPTIAGPSRDSQGLLQV